MRHIVMICCLLFSLSANAGLGSMAFKGGTSFVAYQGFKVAVTKGGPIATKAGLKAVKSYIKKHPEKVNMLTAAMVGFAVEHADLTDRATDFLMQADLINSADRVSIKEDSKEFSRAYSAVETQVAGIEPPKDCNTGIYHEFANSNLTGFMNSVHNPVRIKDTGSYAALKRFERGGDDLEHDHIPSQKAVKVFLEKKLGSTFSRTSAQYKNITNNASTIEIHKTLHAQGRTWRGRNTKLQITLDSKNLRKATLKDFSYHYMNSGFDWSLMSSFVKVYKRNSALCLYRK
ncbi:hypothetical protein [Vibrio harveyi]|uniref:hypothetical protein n=1 Tax=Vibrio harveyi TaxID=669 RepID=UPI003CF7CD57